jgi:hypothetical protein
MTSQVFVFFFQVLLVDSLKKALEAIEKNASEERAKLLDKKQKKQTEEQK